MRTAVGSKTEDIEWRHYIHYIFKVGNLVTRTFSFRAAKMKYTKKHFVDHDTAICFSLIGMWSIYSRNVFLCGKRLFVVIFCL